MTAVNKKKDDKGSNLYNCPVYKYQCRQDKYLIFRVNLPCEQGTASKWKLRGVALLCATDWKIIYNKSFNLCLRLDNYLKKMKNHHRI